LQYSSNFLYIDYIFDKKIVHFYNPLRRNADKPLCADAHFPDLDLTLCGAFVEGLSF